MPYIFVGASLEDTNVMAKIEDFARLGSLIVYIVDQKWGYSQRE